MGFDLRWVGVNDEELDRIAETRLRCYAQSAGEIERYREGIRADPRAGAGDFLLAELDGRAVGTATSMPLTLWVRGAAVPCQGVAYVGTLKTHRRGSGAGSGTGVATRVMHETLRLARERGDVVSALMPFRASYYERFGYGLIERRHDWIVPLANLPAGGFEGIRFFEPADLLELRACRQRMVERGQCDIERSAVMWDLMLKKAADGFVVVDRPAADGPVRGWAYFKHLPDTGTTMLRIMDLGYNDAPSLLRLLHFFASLRDQHGSVAMVLPADLQLNRLLRETQLPHRPVTHATAECRAQTRMQLRVLDPKRLIEPMRLPAHYAGSVSVAVHETGEGEGRGPHVSRFRIEIAQGKSQVTPSPASSSGELEMADTIWAAVACGDLPATAAVRLGLAKGGERGAVVLDALADGPPPFCGEYF